MSVHPQSIDTERERRGRSALRGAALAYFVDMFDIYLPVLVLAPALIYFIPKGIDTSTTSLVGGMIFAATLLGRPLGSAIFGHFADTVGRRRTTVVAVSGFGVCTLLLGLLPGYQQWGTWAIVAFIALRFVDGVFLGGEYSAANPLAMENAPPHRRGYYSAIINCGFPAAYATASVVTLVLLQVMPSGGVDSAYVQWGWRIPFFLGAAMSVALLVYYLRSVEESVLWEVGRQRAPGRKSPIREIFRSGQGRGFAQVFVLMTGLWFSLQTVAAVLPSVLAKTIGLSPGAVTAVLTVSYLLLIPSGIAVGRLSQRLGRRTVLIFLAVLALTAGMAGYAVLLAARPDSIVVVTLLVIVTVGIVDVPFALMPAYINERFSLGVRSSGYGLAYSLSVIIPSFYSFYQVWLAAIMPAEYTVLVLLGLGACLMLVGAAWGPETKDVVLGPVPTPAVDGAEVAPSVR
jgi:MFS family permease